MPEKCSTLKIIFPNKYLKLYITTLFRYNLLKTIFIHTFAPVHISSILSCFLFMGQFHQHFTKVRFFYFIYFTFDLYIYLEIKTHIFDFNFSNLLD